MFSLFECLKFVDGPWDSSCVEKILFVPSNYPFDGAWMDLNE